ncbi:hypothetical protein C3747_126g113 [Trypanosoma cruzi]|uniref:Uncharacterized protein n=2 Tax=Trypanosoma cruzi TaxID=5693 RepID=Q4DAC2_TRYCC|nr:hypothetical protein, conserved [Trypanosoma cruzi]EAN89478.1 hypothetical protein, conserved [Trypanosoma cruzi]PWV05670.1 hypothetical protein C3747_126g113 [Trypanosoma cruzi]RNC45455.1 putative microtubule-associated protein Gb4 [Trypanosoma cruzi]|eukprot:XP_811329.1 hypothetical protein [Trypanosoma cruzi strain CL Brener]
MFSNTSMPVSPQIPGEGLTQSFLHGYTLSTVPSSRGFVSNAETLSPYPDGVCVRVARSCHSNPTLLETTTSTAYRARARSHVFPRRLVSPGSYQRKTSQGLGDSRSVAGFVERGWMYARDDKGGRNDLGYWSVKYFTNGGDYVGLTKLVNPWGDEPPTFEGVVGAIKENALLLGIKVAYVTYFDKDFDTYALLTPRTVQNCGDAFRVVVESISDAAKQSLKLELEGEAAKRRDDATLRNSSGKSDKVSALRQMAGLFLAPKTPSRAAQSADKADPPVPEEWVAKQALVSQEESKQREAISADEESWRLIIQARVNVQLTFWPRGCLS